MLSLSSVLVAKVDCKQCIVLHLTLTPQQLLYVLILFQLQERWGPFACDMIKKDASFKLVGYEEETTDC